MGNYVSDAMGFNRTLMELKQLRKYSGELSFSFNRTLMELKLTISSYEANNLLF